MKDKLKYKKGFTLAEILITLLIIGIVAALSVPSLLLNIQEAQFKVAFKENYAIINAAINKLISDNTENIAGIYSNTNEFNNDLSNYFIYAKKCNTGSAANNCFNADLNYYDLSGVAYNMGINTNAAGMLLNNGTLIAVYNVSPSCADFGHGFARCAWLTFDINGFSKPNVFGRDIFFIHITSNKIVPYGASIDTWGGSDCTVAGFGCAARRLLN